jgi:hypothetical protein
VNTFFWWPMPLARPKCFASWWKRCCKERGAAGMLQTLAAK